MKLYHVVAAAGKKHVIGKDNKLPWHFPEDLKFFKNITTNQGVGGIVIMGRKTFESIINRLGKPLPNREMIYLTRKNKANVPLEILTNKNIRPCSSMADVRRELKEDPFFNRHDRAFIIGGADLYKQTINDVDGIYMTQIYADYEGDAFYPEIPEDFEEIEVVGLREKDPKIQAVYYERKES